MTAITNPSVATKIKSSFKLSDLLNFFMLMSTFTFFLVLPVRNVVLRHAVVFLGTLPFYFLAIKRLFSTKFKKAPLLRLVIMLLIIIFGILATSEEITWQLIYASLNFYSFFVFVSTDNKLVLSEFVNKWSKLIFTSIALLLIIYSQSSIAYVFEDGVETGALVLGMTNPNLTGILIFGVFSMLLIHLDNMRYKFVIMAIMVGLFYLVCLTQSRSSLLAIILLLVYAFFTKIKDCRLMLLF